MTVQALARQINERGLYSVVSLLGNSSSAGDSV